MKRVRGTHVAFYLIAAALAWALKLQYSRAGSVQLRWMLEPTAALVSLATGVDFAFEEQAGCVSADGDIVIAPACAGVNFLIVAFCMLAFTQMRRVPGAAGKAALLAAAALVAYASAVVVNATRIGLSIGLGTPEPGGGWLTPAGMHRIEGIGIYFLALSLLHGAAEALGRRRAPGRGDGLPRGRIGRLLRRMPLLVPLFWYLLVTLGIPLLRMSYRGNVPRFLEHSALVVLIPVLIVLGAAAIRWVCSRTARAVAQAPALENKNKAVSY